MNLFLDTSALVKRYSKEKGTKEIDIIFQDVSADIWISQIAALEIASALSKKVREGEINDSSKRIAIAAFLRDYRKGRFKVIRGNTKDANRTDVLPHGHSCSTAVSLDFTLLSSLV